MTKVCIRFIGLLLGFLVAGAALAEDASDVTAETLIAGALDLVRGQTSFTSLRMTVHRPKTDRTTELSGWTRGREDALIRFTAPAKDAGNATLKKGDKMWTFTPKLNRVIRLPFSLMSQSWAGSDFSYNDLSRSDELLKHYQLAITDTKEEDGHTVYTIEAVPHDTAPVVWGKEVIVLRDDYVMLSQTYFDQNFEPVKRMQTLKVGELGGREFAIISRMIDLEEKDKWTELEYLKADFGIELEDKVFTQFSLRAGVSGV